MFTYSIIVNSIQFLSFSTTFVIMSPPLWTRVFNYCMSTHIYLLSKNKISFSKWIKQWISLNVMQLQERFHSTIRCTLNKREASEKKIHEYRRWEAKRMKRMVFTVVVRLETESSLWRSFETLLLFEAQNRSTPLLNLQYTPQNAHAHAHDIIKSVNFVPVSKKRNYCKCTFLQILCLYAVLYPI